MRELGAPTAQGGIGKRILNLHTLHLTASLHILGQQGLTTCFERCFDNQRIPKRFCEPELRGCEKFGGVPQFT
jgi:hypothetical protein